MEFAQINEILSNHDQNELIECPNGNSRYYSEGVLGQISIIFPDDEKKVLDYGKGIFSDWDQKKPLVLWDSLIAAKVEPTDEFRNEDISYYLDHEFEWDKLKEDLKENDIEYFPKETIAQYLKE